MTWKLICISLCCLILSACNSTVEKKDTVDDRNTVVPGSAHQFTEGEHIFWTSKFENNELVFTVELGPEWMTYSQFNQNIMGPLPTLFTFENSDAFELIGSVEESMVKMKHDKEANEELAYFEKVGVFKQKIKINSGEKFVVKGNVNFMTCNQYGCEPPADYSFEIEIVP